jgi:hypothetical protein
MRRRAEAGRYCFAFMALSTGDSLLVGNTMAELSAGKRGICFPS